LNAFILFVLFSIVSIEYHFTFFLLLFIFYLFLT
jgi:hypothetical protein